MSDVWKFCQKLDEPPRRVKLFIKRTPQRKTFYQMLYPALPEDIILDVNIIFSL